MGAASLRCCSRAVCNGCGTVQFAGLRCAAPSPPLQLGNDLTAARGPKIGVCQFLCQAPGKESGTGGNTAVSQLSTEHV